MLIEGITPKPLKFNKIKHRGSNIEYRQKIGKHNYLFQLVENGINEYIFNFRTETGDDSQNTNDHKSLEVFGIALSFLEYSIRFLIIDREPFEIDIMGSDHKRNRLYDKYLPKFIRSLSIDNLHYDQFVIYYDGA